MAAIVPISFPGSYKLVRSASEQADTGQTDWINVPGWARYLTAFWVLTTAAGTTPILTPALLAAEPNARDDAAGTTVQLHAALTTPPTTSGAMAVVHFGPGITGIADAVALSATASATAFINGVLPMLLGLKTALDRGAANETYTYTLSAYFRG